MCLKFNFVLWYVKYIHGPKVKSVKFYLKTCSWWPASSGHISLFHMGIKLCVLNTPPFLDKNTHFSPALLSYLVYARGHSVVMEYIGNSFSVPLFTPVWSLCGQRSVCSECPLLMDIRVASRELLQVALQWVVCACVRVHISARVSLGRTYR